MSRVIKLKDNFHSIETMEYLPLGPQYGSRTRSGTGIKQQSDETMSEAQNEAQAIIQKAQAEAKNIEEKAFQSGYEAGHESAISEIEGKVSSISKAFEKGLRDIAALKDEILGQAESDIIRLTIAVAERLLCGELKHNPDSIVAIVKEAIKMARSNGDVTIRVNPEDAATLKEHISELAEYISNTDKVRIEGSESLTPGGCIVETETNSIDMSLETRLETIDQLFSEQATDDPAES